MTSTAQGVRRTERYVYNSLHWAFPMLPVTGLLLAGGAPAAWSVPWTVLLAVTGWAGLVVLHTRLRDAEGTRPLATLNGTLCAMTRTIIMILENHQQADGSVRVPEALRPHLGGREFLTPVRG